MCNTYKSDWLSCSEKRKRLQGLIWSWIFESYMSLENRGGNGVAVSGSHGDKRVQYISNLTVRVVKCLKIVWFKWDSRGNYWLYLIRTNYGINKKKTQSGDRSTMKQGVDKANLTHYVLD